MNNVFDLENIFDRIRVTPSCWEWVGSLQTNGYGRIKVNGKSYMAHRVVYELLVKPIPDGLVLDHLCRNVSCVNPEHLEAVTDRINILRGTAPTAENHKKKSCPSGHLYSGDNLLICNGRRFCSTCLRLRDRNKYEGSKRPSQKKMCSCGIELYARGVYGHLKKHATHTIITNKSWRSI